MVDLLMVRDRSTGRFVYTERLERRAGETPWEYTRRGVRREGHVRSRFAGGELEILVAWGTGSVEEFLRAHPEYRSGDMAGDGQLEGDTVDQ
ncbi:MAG: hypothetical protein ACR2JR_00885 [Rubrobacteraceae bacterium]